VLDIANRLDVKVSPKDVADLLEFNSKELSIEAVIEMEAEGTIEEECE
jgi:hypothetical protein